MNVNNTSPELKTISTNNQSSENGSRYEPSTSMSDWRYIDQKQGKKRVTSPSNLNGEKSPKRRNAENPKEDEGNGKVEEQLKEPPSQLYQQPMQMMPTTSYSGNGYATSDYFAVGQSHYMMPQMQNTVHQWDASGMATASPVMSPFSYVVPPDMSMYGMMMPTQGYWMPPPAKPVRVFTRCTLYPPLPSVPPPTQRERPNGCKTVFVAGLPEKITEQIVKEVFAECGEIFAIRMSKKNFCHISFTSEHHVDQALFYSGYCMKIENKDETPYRGRLHVDFAVARNDEYEYQCLRRAVSREERHAALNDPNRPVSPPPIVNYSEFESATVKEQLRNPKTFKEACRVITTWMEKGECNKRNAERFYSMIQSAYSQIKKLVSEKIKIEEELQMAKDKLNEKSMSNEVHFNDMENVFKCASMQKVWDHFTKTQRKNIDTWKNDTSDHKKENQKDLPGQVEMEFSDEEDEEKPDVEKSELLKENQSLRSQIQEKEAAFAEMYQTLEKNYIETKKKLEDVTKEKLALESQVSAPSDRNEVGSASCNCRASCCRSAPCSGRASCSSIHQLQLLMHEICNRLFTKHG